MNPAPTNETLYEEAVERLLIAAEKPVHYYGDMGVCEVRQADLKVALGPDVYAHTGTAMDDLAWVLARMSVKADRRYSSISDDELDEAASEMCSAFGESAETFLENLERSANRERIS